MAIPDNQEVSKTHNNSNTNSHGKDKVLNTLDKIKVVKLRLGKNINVNSNKKVGKIYINLRIQVTLNNILVVDIVFNRHSSRVIVIIHMHNNNNNMGQLIQEDMVEVMAANKLAIVLIILMHSKNNSSNNMVGEVEVINGDEDEDGVEVVVIIIIGKVVEEKDTNSIAKVLEIGIHEEIRNLVIMQMQ